jgi:hypothetical protein
MKKWLRRIRGALGTAVTWALAWSGVGIAVGLLNVVLAGAPLGAVMATFAVAWAKMGFIGGAIFSVVVGVAERRRAFHEMSVPRFAAWGALGALVFGLPIAAALGFTAEMVVGFSTVVLLGAGSAAGSLAIARRSDDRELLEEGQEPLGLLGTH